MDNLFDCDIIIDLLPSYIDGLVSKETAEIVENHMDSCSKCKEVYEQMIADITIGNGEEDRSAIKKRIKRKKRLKKSIFWILVIGYLLVLGVLDILLIYLMSM